MFRRNNPDTTFKNDEEATSPTFQQPNNETKTLADKENSKDKKGRLEQIITTTLIIAALFLLWHTFGIIGVEPSSKSIDNIQYRAIQLNLELQRTVRILNSATRKKKLYRIHLLNETSIDPLKKDLSVVADGVRKLIQILPKTKKRDVRSSILKPRRSANMSDISRHYKLGPDPKIDNLTYYRPTGSNFSMSIREIRRNASMALRLKGITLLYNNTYANFSTRGNFYKYNQSYNDSCLVGS